MAEGVVRMEEGEIGGVWEGRPWGARGPSPAPTPAKPVPASARQYQGADCRPC